MGDVLHQGFRATSPNPADDAVMLGREDDVFKKVMDLAMSRTMLASDAEKLYRKWFQQPIPPSGVELDIPTRLLLRDSFKFRTDKVAD